jgi:putative lipoic acid-binding regulatory protein
VVGVVDFIHQATRATDAAIRCVRKKATSVVVHSVSAQDSANGKPLGVAIPIRFGSVFVAWRRH